MPSAVLDSTVLISAFLAQRGVSNELLRYAREGAFLLCLSEEILDEAQGVLLDEERRHRQRYHYLDEAAIHFIDGLRAFASLVTDIPEVSVVSRAPNDDMVVATAQRAQAAYIVTRDKDLLSLQHYEGITMITPEAFIGGMIRGLHTCYVTVGATGRLSAGEGATSAGCGGSSILAQSPHGHVRRPSCS